MKSKGRNITKSLTVQEIFLSAQQHQKNLNLYSSQIPAGFPSPAEDFMEKRLDLNDYLVKNESSTFLVRVKGHSMVNAGIFDGDLLVVDRSVEPVDGKIILGILNGEFTVKRIVKEKNKLILAPENESFNPIEITEEMDFKIWGVVSFSIHKV